MGSEDASTQDKVVANRLRRWAERLGLTLTKSRAKQWAIGNQCGYRLVDPENNSLVLGEYFELTLDEVADFLKEYEARLRAGNAGQ